MGNLLQRVQKYFHQNPNRIPIAVFDAKRLVQPCLNRKHETSLSYRINATNMFKKLENKRMAYEYDSGYNGLRAVDNTLRLELSSSHDVKNDVEKFLRALVDGDKLHKWKGLKHIDICIDKLYPEKILLASADFLIQRLRDLQSIKLSCFNSSFCPIQKGALEIFVKKVTKHMTHLTKFELIFIDQDEISDSTVKSMVRQIIRNLPYLEILTICFLRCPYVTKKCFDAFGFSTRGNLLNLKKLNLAFEEKYIPHFKFNFDIRFPNLQSLHLNLSLCSDTSDNDLKIFASNVLTKLHSLQEMVLEFRYFLKITDEGMEAFSSCISQNPWLKILEINFSGCRGITDKGLKSFAQEICRKNINLKDFRVFFSDCHLLEDSGIISLAEELKTHFKSLEKLHLDFLRTPLDNINTSDDSLRAISEALSSHSKSLKSIKLNFSGCSKITKNGLKALIEKIEEDNMKNLKQVRLYFRWCPLIGKEEIKKIKKKFNAYSHVDFEIEWSQR